MFTLNGANWNFLGGWIIFKTQNLEPFDLKSCLSQTDQGFGASVRVQIVEDELFRKAPKALKAPKSNQST